MYREGESLYTIVEAVIVVVIAWYLDLQLPMQSVPIAITTKVVSSNPTQARCSRYKIM